jgi:hypothetical protein
MLHLGDDLAGDFQLGRDAIDAVGVQPDDRLGDNGRWVELIRNRDPVVAAEATLCEPATDFAPRACLVRALALDAPSQARATVASRVVVHADNAQMLQPAPRQPE